MGSNEGLSDLDLELLGEKPSTPVNTNERPATSPGPVQVFGTKAPTQAGSTNKSPSSNLPRPVEVSGTKAPTQAGLTNKSPSSTSPGPAQVLGTKAPIQAGSTTKSPSSTSPGPTQVLGTKAPIQAGSTNKSSSSTSPGPVEVLGTKAPTQTGLTNTSRSSTSPDRIHVFGTKPPVQAGFTINSVHLPSVFGPVVTPKVPQIPTTDPTPLPSGHRSILTPTKLQNPTMSAQGMSDKTDAIKAGLEDPNKLTRRDFFELMRKCNKSEKATEDISKKLYHAEAENTALKDRHLKVEEQLKEELNKISKKLSSTEGENAELNERYTRVEEALRAKVEQAVNDGKRAQVTEQTFDKLKTEYETMKEVHTVMEHKSKTQTNQVIGCEKKVTKTMKDLADYRAAAEAKEARLQQSNANLKKGLEDSRRLIQSSGIEQRRAEIDGLSAHVDAFEESRRDWEETENQLEDDLAAVKAVLDEKEQKILSMVEENKKLIQAKKDLKKANQDLRHQQNTQTSSTTKEAQGSSKHNTQTNYSTDEDQGSLDKNPPRSLKKQFHDFGIQSSNDEASEEEEKTVTIHNFKPPSTFQAWTQTEAEKTVTLAGDPLPPRATHSQGVQTELESTQGVQTDIRSTHSQGVQTVRFTQSQGVQTDLGSTQSQGVQTDIRSTQSQGVQTELRFTQSRGMQTEPTATQSKATQTKFRSTQSQGVQTEPTATQSQAVQTEPKETIILNEKNPWYMRNYTQAIFGTVMVSALLMLLFWAWSQCQAATKERKMWMLANDHAYRLSDEVIRKQAIALLLKTQDRARLGWLTPEKIMTLHQGAHQAFTRTFYPLVSPTRSISTASLVQSAMPPTPATTRLGAWPAWSDSL